MAAKSSASSTTRPVPQPTVAQELYEFGYQRAAIQDGHTLVAGVDADPNGHRHWWTSLKPATPLRRLPKSQTAELTNIQTYKHSPVDSR